LSKIHFNIITIFPEFFKSPLKCGLLGKAVEKGIISFSFINPRDFATDKHRSVDDKPYGGGPGMVFSLPPLVSAIRSIKEPGRIILLSAKGKVFTHETAKKLAKEKIITFICGRYEGIDERIMDIFELEPVSIGDFVLTGGESACLCMIEAIARFVPDYMGKKDSLKEESFSSNLLEYPHYTRPSNFEGHLVPEVLLSGNHKEIEKWRRRKSLEITLLNRPDLIDKARLSVEDILILKEIERERLGKNLYLALLHWPILNKHGEVTSVSITNLDIHDIARVAATYSLGGYFLITPIKDQQLLAKRIINYWLEGFGAQANPLRSWAMKKVRIYSDLEEVIDVIKDETGYTPLIIATTAKIKGTLTYLDVRNQLKDNPVLLLFGTGYGISFDHLKNIDGVLRSIRFLDKYNHLSVRSAVSIVVDRILSDYF